MSLRHQLLTLSALAYWDQKKKEIDDQKKQLPVRRDRLALVLQELQTEYQKHLNKHDVCVEEKRQIGAQLDQEKANVRKWESRAEKIKGEREYTALMSEIGSQKRLISDLETRLNTVSDTLKNADKEAEKLKSQVTQAQNEVQEEEAELAQAIAALEGSAVHLYQTRNRLLSELPTLLLKKYEQVSGKRGGIGISVIKRQVCQSCMRTLPPELHLRVLRAEMVEQCPACQRLLVSEEMFSAVSAEQGVV